MSTNLIPVKNFLGKYYSELLYSSVQEKYKDSKLDTIFDQRFYIQNNKTQMIVDQAMAGLSILVTGNEIHVSKSLYDHDNVVIINSLEQQQLSNPRSLYNPDTFSTVAYLVCQNHTTFQIIGNIDEPVYVKYHAACETLYNSVVIFDISNDIEVEIVEEIESHGALNAVSNYILHPYSNLKLTTFYQNNISASSFIYRNIISQDYSRCNHIVLGKGSANIVDENKIHMADNTEAEFLGVINSIGKNFHSILNVVPESPSYKIDVNYRGIVDTNSSVTFYPAIVGQEQLGEKATVLVTDINIDDIPRQDRDREVQNYVSDIVGKAILDRMDGVTRFYDNKSKFMHLP